MSSFEIEKYYPLLVETARDFILVHDLNGKIFYINTFGLKLSGYEKKEVIGQDVKIFLAPEALKDLNERRAKRTAGIHDDFRYESKILTKNGEMVPVEVNSSVIMEKGSPVGILIVARDTSKRKEIEEALVRSERELQERNKALSMINSIANVMHESLDLDIVLNNAVFSMMEYVRSPLVAIYLYDEENDILRLAHSHGFSETLVNKAKVLPLTNSLNGLVLKDKRIISVEEISTSTLIMDEIKRELRNNNFKSITVLPLVYHDEKLGTMNLIFKDPYTMNQLEETALMSIGKTVGLAIANAKHLKRIKDEIAQRIKLEEEKQKIQEQLLQAQKMEAIGRLAGGIAHDFNNLLTAISSYSDMIYSSLDPDDENIPYIKEIRKSTDRAASLTRQLLAFGRKQILTQKPLNLNDMIAGLGTMLKRIIGENILLETNLDPNLETMRGDLSQIEQVIMNLVLNAKDSIAEYGTITIETDNEHIDINNLNSKGLAKPGDFVVLKVRDTGSGIDDEILPYIFEPFFTTKSENEGTGLGLSVAFGIVKQHDGWINVSSKKGSGTEFKIYFPAARTSEMDINEGKKHPATEKITGKGEKILVVEDEEIIRSLIDRVLSANGYCVTLSSTIAKAIELFENSQEEYDLVLSDVVLPDGNGIKLVEKIKSIKPDIPVILSSGYSEKQTQGIESIGVNYRFLPKLYKPSQLLEIVYSALKAE